MRRWVQGLMVGLAFVSVWAQGATQQVASETALRNAITAAAAGDRIEITKPIVVTADLVLSRNISISGGGHLISVPFPGVNEDGSNRAGGASGFRVFTVNSPAVVVLEDMHLKGGYVGEGGAMYVQRGATATLNRVTISNSRGGSRAGGLANFGTVYLNDGRLMRNSAVYAGGFVNRGGKMFINRSTFSDNRSESAQGGGGAGESEGDNGLASVMFVNNSTFANNKSTEHGGAIKNNGSALYVSNSTFTGNVAYGNPTDVRGGAIGITGGGNESKVFLVNNVFAYNYRQTAAGFELDDFHWHPGSTGELYGYYNVYHGSRTAGSGWTDKPTLFKADVQNVDYTALANGSNDTIFSGGFLSRVTDGSGAEVASTAKVFQPYVVNDSGYAVPSLKASSSLLLANMRGVRTAALLDATAPGLAYSAVNDWTTWTNIVGTPGGDSVNHVTLDQLGSERVQPPQNLAPVRGATSYALENLFQVKVLPGAGGQVQGGSVYGDVYPSGTSVTLTALANSGQTFTGWYNEAGNPLSNNVIYTFTVTANAWVQPRFTATTDGLVAVTYAGNGATSGNAPASVRVTPGQGYTTASVGALSRPGYTLSAWNTEPNGAGTAYNPNASVTPNGNLSLYAQWAPVRTATVTVNAQPVTLSMSCLSCAMTSATTAAVPAGGPANTNFRYQLQQFELIDVQGPVQVTLTFPEAIPAGETLWKLKSGVWSAVTGAVVAGSSVTYTVIDNGPLDEADTVTGVIRDPVGMAFGALALAPGAADVVGVPVDSDVLRWMAVLCIALYGGSILRARERNGQAR